MGAMNNCGPTFADHITEQINRNDGEPIQMLTTFKKWVVYLIHCVFIV